MDDMRQRRYEGSKLQADVPTPEEKVPKVRETFKKPRAVTDWDNLVVQVHWAFDLVDEEHKPEAVAKAIYVLKGDLLQPYESINGECIKAVEEFFNSRRGQDWLDEWFQPITPTLVEQTLNQRDLARDNEQYATRVVSLVANSDGGVHIESIAGESNRRSKIPDNVVNTPKKADYNTENESKPCGGGGWLKHGVTVLTLLGSAALISVIIWKTLRRGR